MRTITTAQEAVLARRKYQVVVHVEIEDSTATLVEVSDFEGFNWIEGVEYGDGVDTAVATARVRLAATRYNLSMRPLDEDSKINLPGGVYAAFLDVRRQIRILTATVPQDYTPVAGDFELVFDGFIDQIPEAGKDDNTITLECRDKGSVLQDTWIEDLERYGDGTIDGTDRTPGTGLLEEIIQDIFDNWVSGTTLFSENGTGGTPFNAGDTPAFSIQQWDVDIQSVMDAIRIGANSIGWECRYRWQTNQDEFEVQLYEPDRTKVAVDRTFSPADYIDVRSLTVDLTKVRNVIEITYWTDPDDDQSRATVEVSDAASITRYGRRWFGIVEAATSAINTSGEATSMATAILNDLREPDRDQEIEMLYFWAAELGDLYTFEANGLHYSTDQTWAVVGIKHTISAGRQRTMLTTRRAPSGGVKHWWRRGQIGGIGNILKDKIPTAPTVSLDVIDHGVLVTWDNILARLGGIAYYEVHISTTVSFTPSSSTLIAKTQGTRYRANGLDQRVPYFVKILAVDNDGNVSSNSNEVTSEPGYLRGFPGILSTTDPDETTLQPGQMVLSTANGKQGQVLRRWDETYTDLALQDTTQEPTAYYKQNESAGPTATDESSNGNDGTYTGVSFTQGPIVPNGAGQCAGYFGSARIDLDNLNLLAQTAISWEAWLEVTPAVGGGWAVSSVRNLFDCDNAAGTSQWQAFFQAGANRKAAILNVRVGNNLITFAGVTAQDFYVDGPAHIAITWDNGDGFVHVYKNGVLISTSTAVHLGGTLDIDDCTFFNDQGGASIRSIEGLSDHMIFWVGAEIPAAEIKERVDLAGQPDVRFERVTPITQIRGKYFNSVQQVAVGTGTIVDFDSAVEEHGMTMTTVGANVGRLVINEDGLYAVTFAIVMSSAVAAGSKIGRVTKNGILNPIVRTNREVGGTSPTVTGAGEVYLRAGDFLEVDIILSSGTVTILSSSTASTRGYLTVRRVGEGMNVN